jgi:hypothetical protein
LVSDNQQIFVSIASYRDIQLVPTLQDLLAKAAEPSLLRFGICWQHDINDPPLPFEIDPRFQVIDVDWRNSRGACWARAEIMKLWQGEQWYLQIDSHCRFTQNWDTKLIRMMGQTGSPKPILSTYANGFMPRVPGSNASEILSGPPHLIAIESFTEEGIPKLKPLEIPNPRSRKQPMPARFLAAGFLFAPGSFVEEVPYDPELYFFGEEISMTLRAFTSGYDLFHPIENIAWHDYIRTYATRHWDDHTPTEPTSAEPAPATERSSGWTDLDKISRQKVRQLLQANPQANPDSNPATNPATNSAEDTTNPAATHQPDRFGLGSIRTREDYERYAGISFELRKFQDYTRYAHEPPNPPAPDDWPDRIYTWLIRIAVKTAALSPGALDDRSFWVVAIQDEHRREIRRHDFQRQDLTISGTEPEIVLICEIQSGIIPAYWSVLPFSRSKGWGMRLEGALADSDFSIIADETNSA